MINEGELILNEDIDILDLKNILSTRQWLYDFLGQSFYMELKLNELKKICDINIFAELVDDEGNSEGWGVKILSDFFKGVLNLTEKDIHKLNLEYNRLFVGPGHVPVPPWESVYISKEKIIFDEHTLAVREFYKRWDVNTKRINKDPDDHIGFELEFMSILSSRSLRALEENNIEDLNNTILGQKEFLEKHLLLWIDEFADNLLRNTNEEFYIGLGLFTLEYLKMDGELLRDIISSFDTLVNN